MSTDALDALIRRSTAEREDAHALSAERRAARDRARPLMPLYRDSIMTALFPELREREMRMSRFS